MKPVMTADVTARRHGAARVGRGGRVDRGVGDVGTGHLIDPLRRVVEVDETGYHVKFTLECGCTSLMKPYKFKDHKPYPTRRRCSGCGARRRREARKETS